jgi:hypothetical protein
MKDKQKSQLLLLLLVIGALTTIPLEPTSAVSTPTTPEFTLKYVDNSYDVPTTYKTDDYTGKTVVNVTGYHVDNRSIEVAIKNQEFSYSADGTTYFFFYNVRYKGHYGTEWKELFPLYRGCVSQSAYLNDNYSFYITSEIGQTCPETVDSQYTVVLIPLAIDSSGAMDVQVKAMVGHLSDIYVGSLFYPEYGSISSSIICDTTSDWSNLLTITIGSGETINSQPASPPSQTAIQPIPSATITQATVNPTESTNEPNKQTDALNFTWKDIALIVACGIIAVLAVALVLTRRKKT